MNPILIQKTLARIAQTTGGQITNPSMLTAQLLGGACSPSLAQAAAEATVTLSGLTDPAQNPELWNAILLQQMLSMSVAIPATIARTADQIIRGLNPLFWFNGNGIRLNNFNTGTVDRWADMSPNAVDAVGSGYPTVSGTRVNGRIAVTLADGLSFAATFPTITNLICVAKVANNADNNFLITNNVDTYWQLSGAATGRPVPLWWVTPGQTVLGYRKTFAAGVYRIFTLRVQRIGMIRGTAPQYLYTCGIDNYETILNGNGTVISGMTSIGGYPGTTYDLNADVAFMAGFGPMSQLQRDDAIAAVIREFNLTPARSNRLIGIGDSLMAGPTPATAMPYYLLGDETTPGTLSTDWNGYNAGVGGWSTRDILGGGIHGILQAFSRHTNNVAVLSFGTNNYGISTPAEVAADTAEICRIIREHKGRTLINPMFPRGPAGNATYEPFRIALNPLLAGLKTAGIADDYVDPAIEPLLWDPGANLNTTYFNVDQTHTNAAGNSLWATRITTQVNALAALPPLQ